jgi:hypothetical protein
MTIETLVNIETKTNALDSWNFFGFITNAPKILIKKRTIRQKIIVDSDRLNSTML